MKTKQASRAARHASGPALVAVAFGALNRDGAVAIQREQKHPAIIPKTHHSFLTFSITAFVQQKLGKKATLLSRFWLIDGKLRAMQRFRPVKNLCYAANFRSDSETSTRRWQEVRGKA